MKRMALSIALMLLAGPTQADPPPSWTFQATPAPEWSAQFEQNDGWIGGDGVYPVQLSANRIAWFFGDTWIGKIQNGKRVDCTMVNNTMVIRHGRGLDAPADFIVRRDDDKKAVAFVAPKDGRGWFWPFASAMVNDQLIMFLAQIEKTNDTGVFAFRQVALWMGIVANPNDPPLKWRIEQIPVPFCSFSGERNTTFGMATCAADGFLYIFGTDENITGNNRSRHMIVARVGLDKATDANAWRFFADGKWVEDYRHCSHLAGDAASEGSVSYLPALKQYAFVYTHLGLSDQIMMRTAPNPWGPWSSATKVFTCPEMAADKNLFTYAAKGQPAISGADELLISYAVNSFDFWQVARDARLYWPKFVRVKFSTPP